MRRSSTWVRGAQTEAGTQSARAVPAAACPAGDGSARAGARERATVWWRHWLRPVLPVWAATQLGLAAALVAGALANGTGVRHAWTRWDGGWFLHIAANGYDDRAGAPAFYPLYPVLVRGAGELLGGRLAAGAVAVSLAGSLAALALLHRLVAERAEGAGTARAAGAARARWTVALVALFPFALFLQLAYSESLFLLLAAGVALALQRGRLVTAGALAGVAFLARPLAFALVVAVAVAALEARAWRRGVVAMAAAGAVFALYPLLLVQQGRSWLAFAHAETLWQRELSPLGPLGGLERGLRAAWAGVLQLTWGPQKPYWTSSQPDLVAVLNVTNLLALAAALAALPLVKRALGRPWVAFCAAVLLLPLAEPSTAETPLLSMGRFVLVLFPLAAGVAAAPRLRRLLPLVGVISGALLLAVIGWWTTGEFVA